MAKPITSLTGFVRKLSAIQENNKSSLMLYRGHKLKSYETQPSVFRSTNHLKSEHLMIRQLISEHPNEFSSDQSTFERLVRAQHYGLPTRLLDVTRNPLVALYFSCDGGPNENGQVLVIKPPIDKQKYFDSDVVSCMSNLCYLKNFEKSDLLDCGASSFEKHKELIKSDIYRYDIEVSKTFNDNAIVDRLVQFIRGEKPNFKPMINPFDLARVVSVVPRKLHARLVAQEGAFLLFGLFGFDEVNNWMDDFDVIRIDISKKSKAKMLQELSLVGINQSTLFPEIEKSATQIRNRYK